MSIRKAGAGYSSNSSKFVSMIAGEFLDKYTKKPFYISACLVLIGFLVLAGGFIAMRVYRRKNMEVANYYSSSVSSGPDYSAQQGPMGDNFDREYNEMFDDGYVNPDQQIFKPLNNGNDSNDWRGF